MEKRKMPAMARRLFLIFSVIRQSSHRTWRITLNLVRLLKDHSEFVLRYSETF